MPTFADPTTWVSSAETERATYRFETRGPASLKVDEVNVARFEKPSDADSAQVTRAAQDERAQSFLQFARFPVVQLQTEGADTLVQFADLRFTTPGRARSPNSGFSLDVHVPPATQ